MTGGGKGDGSGINTILRTRLSQGYAAANIIMRSGRGGRDTSLSVCVCMWWWTIVATTTTPIASSSPPGRMGNEENNNRNVNNNNNKARVWSRPVFVVHLASQSRLHTSSQLMAFRFRGTSGKMALKCDLLHPHSQVFRPFLNVEWEIRQSSNLLQSPAFACEEDGYRHVECNLTLDCTPTKNLSLSLSLGVSNKISFPPPPSLLDVIQRYELRVNVNFKPTTDTRQTFVNWNAPATRTKSKTSHWAVK